MRPRRSPRTTRRSRERRPPKRGRRRARGVTRLLAQRRRVAPERLAEAAVSAARAVPAQCGLEHEHVELGLELAAAATPSRGRGTRPDDRRHRRTRRRRADASASPRRLPRATSRAACAASGRRGSSPRERDAAGDDGGDCDPARSASRRAVAAEGVPERHDHRVKCPRGHQKLAADHQPSSREQEDCNQKTRSRVVPKSSSATPPIAASA